ncbi:ribonucleoside-diphosphate reductase subunit alpha [Desertimonas flava]|jgi:ribonucleoside-diphosphate reductase alpha chain|uniref:ribonucleoside-diphosphate reductase subunit alpha n=1 Tax=Desertimonas flava TaxID=2064846 RepID=UPI000E348DE7|nr:ribonucleoside-diphosphate reductase subunit alpha [Desertimonas flava]
MTILERTASDSTLAPEAGDAGADPTPWGLASPMRVRKRDGALEPIDLNKIVRAVGMAAKGLDGVDPMRVATRTISGLHDGATTMELDELSIRTAAALVSEEPSYSRLAGRLLATFVQKEVFNQNIHSFSQSIDAGHAAGLINDETAELVGNHSYKLNEAIEHERDRLFEYFGLRTVYDRYLLRDPEGRLVIETPQYFFMRVACGLSTTADEAIEFYRIISSLDYMPATPTLFNSGTSHPQMSSCYLLDSPGDTLEAIYDRYKDVARLSKFAGGIGLAFHRVRSRGSLIRGTNGLSNGIVPWLKTLDSSVSAVNQGGKRKGAACVYLETWHADIEEFLELKDNTGDEARRTHNLNLANWVPDLFMKRVENDWTWSLFDPKKVPHLTDLFGEEFERAYIEAESQKLYERQIPARQLYSRMMRTLAQTGNGWMTFKDPSNARCNQTTDPVPGVVLADGETPRVVHLSNLCTEILEVTSNAETAVCNLGSLNLGHFVRDGEFEFERLAEVVRTAVRYLDRVIDINYYPTDEAAASNARWRPVGLGVMGLQDVFFKLKLPFDSPEARGLSKRIQEEVYFNALWSSSELAEANGPHTAYADTRAAAGKLQFDLWGVTPSEPARWEPLRARIAEHGLRNSLLIAIAPTATIASICGAYECIEPQVSNLFKRETLSGEFLQINTYLVRDLQSRGLWTDEIRDAIKRAEGSVQGVDAIPDDVKALYRTAWELPMRSLIDMAAERGAFIDQSQSLNLFMESPTIGKLSSMYLHAWKQGLKTTYYLRSRPATRIAQTTTGGGGGTPAPAEPTPMSPKKEYTDEEALACSIENPDACEACT